MNAIKSKLIMKLNEAAEFYLSRSDNDDDAEFDFRYILLAKEFDAASAAARRAQSDDEIPHRHHIIELLVLLSTDYEKQGWVFQGMDVDVLVDELCGYGVSAIKTGDVDTQAQ
ncbi:MAG: hypothetical protein JWM36_144 [Hyphomicrobiales bacterium]|nr:hypothetical protein [Hyphomicrobiales bacterium]